MVDLIVMGTHGRGGMLHLMLGSVAEAVMRHTYSPLLIIRNPEQQPGKAPMLQ
jgi:nucleotide-binding universal stress UspA family protein